MCVWESGESPRHRGSSPNPITERPKSSASPQTHALSLSLALCLSLSLFSPPPHYNLCLLLMFSISLTHFLIIFPLPLLLYLFSASPSLSPSLPPSLALFPSFIPTAFSYFCVTQSILLIYTFLFFSHYISPLSHISLVFV